MVLRLPFHHARSRDRGEAVASRRIPSTGVRMGFDALFVRGWRFHPRPGPLFLLELCAQQSQGGDHAMAASPSAQDVADALGLTLERQDAAGAPWCPPGDGVALRKWVTDR